MTSPCSKCGAGRVSCAHREYEAPQGIPEVTAKLDARSDQAKANSALARGPQHSRKNPGNTKRSRWANDGKIFV